MSIVFQNGEFFSADSNLFYVLNLIVTFFGILSGAFFAVFVLWKGERIKQLEESERLGDSERYLTQFVSDLTGSISKQNELFDKLIPSIKNEAGNFSFEYISSVNTHDIDWISRADRYEIFVKTKTGDGRIELLRKFNAICDYLNTFISEFAELKSDFMKEYSKYERDWAKAIGEIGAILDRLNANYRIQFNTIVVIQANDPFLFTLLTLRQNWTAMNNYLYMTVASQHFIDPLIAMLNLHQTNPATLDLLKSATECREAAANMQATRDFYAQTIEQRRLKFASVVDDLKAIEEKLGGFKKAVSASLSLWHFTFESLHNRSL